MVYLAKVGTIYDLWTTRMDNTPFTLDQLQETIDSIMNPTLLYGTSEFAERGQVYICKETQWTPKFVILHPDDLESFSNSLPNMRLVHLRDELKEDMAERIKSRLAQSAMDHHAPIEFDEEYPKWNVNLWRYIP